MTIGSFLEHAIFTEFPIFVSFRFPINDYTYKSWRLVINGTSYEGEYFITNVLTTYLNGI